jgi:hypothetical protein
MYLLGENFRRLGRTRDAKILFGLIPALLLAFAAVKEKLPGFSLMGGMIGGLVAIVKIANTIYPKANVQRESSLRVFGILVLSLALFTLAMVLLLPLVHLLLGRPRR